MEEDNLPQEQSIFETETFFRNRNVALGINHKNKTFKTEDSAKASIDPKIPNTNDN